MHWIIIWSLIYSKINVSIDFDWLLRDTLYQQIYQFDVTVGHITWKSLFRNVHFWWMLIFIYTWAPRLRKTVLRSTTAHHERPWQKRCKTRNKTSCSGAHSGARFILFWILHEFNASCTIYYTNIQCGMHTQLLVYLLLSTLSIFSFVIGELLENSSFTYRGRI